MRSLLKAPRIAWPTIALWLALTGTWLLVFVASIAGLVGSGLCTLLSTILAFWIFTPIHEAGHSNIVRSQWGNLGIGHCSSVILAIPFVAFRYAHLEHHRHTNDPVRDPDHFSGRGPTWQLPFRWLTIDLHYYRWLNKGQGGMGFLLLLVAIAASLAVSGFGSQVVFCWLLPSRLAIGLIAFSFSYFPHAPHTTTAKLDRYRASTILLYPGLTGLLLFQNYHLIHHLYPGVPFYRYARIFRAKREELLRRGAAVFPKGKSSESE